MRKLTHAEVEHIAALARLGLTEADKERFADQLSSILENMEALKEVDTAGVPPTAQSIALHNVFRHDRPGRSCPVQDVLSNAPQREGDSFRVRPVLE